MSTQSQNECEGEKNKERERERDAEREREREREIERDSQSEREGGREKESAPKPCTLNQCKMGGGCDRRDGVGHISLGAASKTAHNQPKDRMHAFQVDSVFFEY